MAKEVSRKSPSSAFLKRLNVEERQLREKLSIQLQHDVGRIYEESLYWDLELVVNSKSILTHKSILEARTEHFLTTLKLLSSNESHGLHSLCIEDSSVGFIENFIRSVYTKCGIEKEELDVVKRIQSSSQLYSDHYYSPTDVSTSLEIDVYSTAESSPSEVYCDSSSNSFLAKVAEPDHTLACLHKSNQSYYSLVPVEDDLRSVQTVHSDYSTILDKELSEQDQLFQSLNCISLREKSKSKAINKPTSLPIHKSHASHSIKIARKEHNFNSFVPCKKQINTIKTKKVLSGQERFWKNKQKFNTNTNIADSSVTSFGIHNSPLSSSDISNAQQTNVLESLNSLHWCCTTDLDSFPSSLSPEMELSTGGPDSGIDTSSTGGIDFSSPREHTCSETSGVDVTETVGGEDIPHDDIKSSISSSLSSEAGTCEASYPQAEQQIPYCIGSTTKVCHTNIPMQSDDVANYKEVLQSVRNNPILTEHPLSTRQSSSLNNGVCDSTSCASSELNLISQCTSSMQQTQSSQEKDMLLKKENDTINNKHDVLEIRCLEQIVPQLEVESKTDISKASREEENEVQGDEPLTFQKSLDHNSYFSSSMGLNDNIDQDWHTTSSLSSNGNNYFIDASSLLDDNEPVVPIKMVGMTEISPSPAFNVASSNFFDGNKSDDSTLPGGDSSMKPTKQELKIWEVQNVTAEFEKEIKLSEHMEPQPGKFQASRKKVESVIQETLEDTIKPLQNKELIDSFGSDIQIVPSSSSDKLSTKLQSGNSVSPNFDTESNQGENVLKHSKTESDIDKSDREDATQPNLIRRNTFELEPDDDRLTLLRQDYERRQGNLLFQNCIPQYSTHVTGSEGLQDGRILHDDSLLVSSKHGMNICADSLNGSNLDQTAELTQELTNKSMTASLVTNAGTEHIETCANTTLENKTEALSCKKVPCPVEENFTVKCENVITVKDENLKNKVLEKDGELLNGDVTGEVEEEKQNSTDTLQVDNGSSKHVLSGGITKHDIVVEPKVTDSPRGQRRTESTPIVSGGVSTHDFTSTVRPTESPILSRRKNEFAPILSGAAPVVIEEEPVPERKVVPNLTTSWVVDMGQPIVTSKPPLDTKRRMSDGTLRNGKLQAVEGNNQPPTPPRTTGLGFFVDLSDPPEASNVEASFSENEDMNVTQNNSGPSEPTSDLGSDTGIKEEFTKHGAVGFRSKIGSDVLHATKKNSCGFYVDLSDSESKKKESDSKKLTKEENSSQPDKKKSLFSMFIDIGDATHRSSEGRICASPHLSMHRKFKNSTPDRAVTSKSNLPKMNTSTFDVDDGSTIEHSNSASAVSDIVNQEQIEEKKQGFFMFVETDSPVTRRKTLPSGIRPSFNRHSWNADPKNLIQPCEEPRRKHKRAHSLSVDHNISSPNEDKTSSSASLSKSKNRGSSQSLQEALSPDQSSLTHFSEISSRQMSSSCYTGSRLPSKSFDKLTKRLSYEGKTDSERDVSDLYSDTISEGKMINEEESQVTDVETIDDPQEIDNSDHKFDTFDQTLVSRSSMSKEHQEQPSQSTCGADGNTFSTNKEVSIGSPPQHQTNIDGLVDSPASLDHVPEEEVGTKSDIERTPCMPAENGSHMHVNTTLKNGMVESHIYADVEETKPEEKPLESFVKLSDLDKEPVREEVSETSDVLPSFATVNRMTRSIPETSWIESKIVMTRSIGGATTSRSLSRLFPHLHSTMTASSVSGRSKSPAEGDEQSEVSDISSMQSSMAASGLEGSTEETDTSMSVRGPVSRLGEDLLRMFLEEISPDVTVDVGGRRIKAHKCILSSRCQYFAAMLSGGWVESAGNVISLQGFSYNAVFFALCHIYSGTSTIPDTISIVELATLADMLGLEGLKEVIEYTLKVKYCHFFHKPCTMCAVGVLECLPLAAAYGLDDIYRKSLRWITKHFVRIWPTKGFASLPRELIDKCYQQHVVHMMADNILETVMNCDKLLATLPNVRWAEPVFAITSQLLEASIKFMAHNFGSVLQSQSFLSLGKELSWNISRLEDSLMSATERLPPDQACQSYARLHHLMTTSNTSEDKQYSPSFVDLVHHLCQSTEASLVRQAPRAARCPSWNLMDAELRKHIQEVACLVIVPPEELLRSGHRSSRHTSQSYSRSVSGSRNLDLRQVKLAMTQQARRAASGGRVSTLRADKPGRKSQPIAVIHPHRVDEGSQKLTDGEGDSSSKQNSWSSRTLENHGRTVKQRSSGSGASTDKAATTRRKMISSSDSSRTSSPALRRPGVREAKPLLGNRLEMPLVSRDVRRRRKDLDINMSTDSLTENANEKQSTEADSAIKNCISTRPDTPSLRRKRQDTNTTDSPGDKHVEKEMNKVSLLGSSILPIKKQLGRLADEVSISTDSLATEASYTIEDKKADKNCNLPQSPLTTKADVKGKIGDPHKSPAGAVKRMMRAPLISPRESNTSRLRSAATAAALVGSPTTRKHITKSPNSSSSPNTSKGKITPTKGGNISKSDPTSKTASSPSTSVVPKRPIARVQLKQSVVSPGKQTATTKTTPRNTAKDTSSPKPPNKPFGKVADNANRPVKNGIGLAHIRNKTDMKENVDSRKSARSATTEKALGSRSGTFLKDEPTILKKPAIDNVQE